MFLGFAAAGASEFSIAASLIAITAFLAGALAGGRLGSSAGGHRGRFLAVATYVQLALVGAALTVAAVARDPAAGAASYALIALLALAMGLRNAAARRLGVPDLTTTVLTLTLTGLAADARVAGGAGPSPRRRLLATGAMLLGATVGTLLLFRVGISAVLAGATALLALNAVAGYRLSSSTAPWTAP